MHQVSVASIRNFEAAIRKREHLRKQRRDAADGGAEPPKSKPNRSLLPTDDPAGLRKLREATVQAEAVAAAGVSVPASSPAPAPAPADLQWQVRVVHGSKGRICHIMRMMAPT